MSISNIFHLQASGPQFNHQPHQASVPQQTLPTTTSTGTPFFCFFFQKLDSMQADIQIILNDVSNESTLCETRASINFRIGFHATLFFVFFFSLIFDLMFVVVFDVVDSSHQTHQAHHPTALHPQIPPQSAQQQQQQHIHQQGLLFTLCSMIRNLLGIYY